MRPTKNAFTLLELLVVIAIIGILAALLLSALAKAKSKSLQTQCLNNLKQISLAIQLYADDNNSILPGPVLRMVPAGYTNNNVRKILPIFIWHYLALPDPATQETLATAWPIIACPAQIAVSIPDVTSPGARVTYSTKGRINLDDQTSRPFGYPSNTVPPVEGAPYMPFSMLRISTYTNSLSAVYVLRDVDMEVDTDTSVFWHNEISPQAVHGNDLRNIIYFDWHAEAIHGTNGLE